MVQASHACIESAKQMDADCVPYLVVFGVKSESKLRSLLERISEKYRTYPFYEPDMNNEMTAFATEPVDEAGREDFRKFQLLQ